MMRLRGIGLVAAMAVPLVAMPPVGPAHAQMESREAIALQNQILELQREIQVLAQQRQSGYQGYAPPPSAYGQGGGAAASSEIVSSLLTRVDTLESEVRQLRGRVEELSNQVQQQSAQLGKRLDDLQFQIQNTTPPASGRPSAAASSAAAATPSAPASPPPSPSAGGRRTPELILQDGQAALARNDYVAAEQDAREVLANRSSPRAADAQFLLAQALLGQKQYSQAAIAFDDAYNRSRKGAHAPDSLLGLADSLIAINEKRAACDTLAKLRSEFPNARQEIRDRAAQDSRRAGCR